MVSADSHEQHHSIIPDIQETQSRLHQLTINYGNKNE